MPQFTVEIPNCEETVSNPIVISALARIIRTFKWYADFDFHTPNLGNYVVVKGTEIDLPTHDRSQQRLTTDQKVRVEVSERYDEEAVRATHIRQKTEKNIFYCPLTKTTMHPGYQRMIADITMTFRFRSRHEAENFRKRVRLAATNSVDGMKIEAKYAYTIPFSYLYILKHIHTLMENKHGYGISLGEWLRQSFTGNLTTLANQSGGQSILAINEINQNIIVLVQSPDDIDPKEKESEADSWSVTMQFAVHYDRPELMRIRYQHIINNQFVGMDFASRFKSLVPDMDAGRTNMAQLDVLQAGKLPRGRNPLSGYTSPYFDDWLPSKTDPHYSDMLRIMLVVDEGDPTNVVDLKDLADYEITEPVQLWLRKHHQNLTNKRQDLFWVRLWAWDVVQPDDAIWVDENLMVHAKTPLDPRVNYHLTFHVCREPAELNDVVWEELRNDRDILEEWLDEIIADKPYYKDIVDKLIEDHYERYPDTSEKTIFERDPVDPKTVTVIPPAVMETIKENIKDYGNGRFHSKTVLIYGIRVKKTEE